MSSITLIVAACFGLTGLLICAIILRAFYEALVGPQRGWSERRKLKSREKQLALLDDMIKKGDLSAVFRQLRQVIFFDLVKHDQDLIEQISSLHFAALNKLIALSDARDRHLPELLILEDLFSSRTSLLRSWSEVASTKNTLMRKRNNKMPQWAFDEYQKKLSVFSDQLDTNRKSIEIQLDKIYLSLSSSPSSGKEEIIYH